MKNWQAKLGSFDFDNDGSRPVMSGPEKTEGGHRICMVDSVIERGRKTAYDAPDLERDENAQLIAAAPELLSALEATLPLLPHTADGASDVLHPVLGQVRAAIAKAKGSPDHPLQAHNPPHGQTH